MKMSNRILVFYGTYRSDRMGIWLAQLWSTASIGGAATSS